MSEEYFIIPTDDGVEQVSIQTHDRVTTRMSFYFAHLTENPFHVNVINNRLIRSSGIEVYSHRCLASLEWSVLDYGWIDRNCVSKVIIENLEGRGVLTNRTAEEEKRSSERVLQVAYEGAPSYCFYVPPGDALPVIPNPAHKLMVRCMAGTTPYRVTVFPG